MRLVLLDKNAGAKKLSRSCTAEGVVDCQLLPLDVRDADDPDVHEHARSRNALLLTNDRRLWYDSYHAVAGKTSGILLVYLDEDTGKVRQITRKTTQNLLQRFKSEFPEWHEVTWEGHILELSDTNVRLIRARDPDPEYLPLMSFNDSNWAERLRGYFAGSGGSD
jgi:predicted nuclease of predicted toxin-antitoxin system